MTDRSTDLAQRLHRRFGLVEHTKSPVAQLHFRSGNAIRRLSGDQIGYRSRWASNVSFLMRLASKVQSQTSCYPPVLVCLAIQLDRGGRRLMRKSYVFRAARPGLGLAAARRHQRLIIRSQVSLAVLCEMCPLPRIGVLIYPLKWSPVARLKPRAAMEAL